MARRYGISSQIDAWIRLPHGACQVERSHGRQHLIAVACCARRSPMAAGIEGWRILTMA
jgi:hypothetical protein